MVSRRIRSPLAILILAYCLDGPALAQGESMVAREIGFLERIAAHIEHGFGAMWGLLAAAPRIPGDLARALGAIAETSPRSLLTPLMAAAAITLLTLMLPPAIRLWAIRTLSPRHLPDTRIGRAIGLIVIDVAALAIAVALAATLVNLLFDRHVLMGQLAVAVVSAAALWRLTILAPEILLRPGQPDLRLIAIDEDKARLAVRVAGVVLGLGTVLVSVMPVLRAAGFPQGSAQALALIVGTLMMIAAAWGIWRMLDHVYTRNAALGLGLVLLVWLVWSVAVVRVDFALYHGLVWSIGIIAAVIALDRLLALQIEPASGEPSGRPSRVRTLAVTTLRRSMFAIVGTLVAGLIARLWLVDLLGVVDQDSWARVREAVITALAVIVIGYVIYQALSAWIEAKLGASHGAALPGDSDDELAPASRFESVLPLLRGVFGALILATATLVALSHLGISVAPLIAGAGIFGLAVSFGSQALVRDIVSGVFYLSDDAFRVGEYISAGSHKGTVERIALRSLRVRHQNGQVHTIPYGQLGAVTNFSRDYQTVKFNLRLARKTDVEKARKLAKKLGQEMLEDPELGKEFIQPFKLQGVADIQENALVCRFKFTARPTKPTWVQREVLKRLYQRFTDEGIEFATNAVVIQGPPGTSQEASAGAAQVLTFPRADAKD